jgi:hypothetical protein
LKLCRHKKQFPSAEYKQKSQDVAKQAKNLNVSIVANGYFLDYWVYPGIPSYMTQLQLYIDPANNFAAIPGSGDVPITFTHTSDVGKFVAASLDLEEWPPILGIVGDRVTWKEFVRIAEEAKGKVSYPSTALLIFLKKKKKERERRKGTAF